MLSLLPYLFVHQNGTRSNQQKELQKICQRTLDFENYFLLIYKDYLLAELKSKDKITQRKAIKKSREVIYPDQAVDTVLESHKMSEDNAGHTLAYETLKGHWVGGYEVDSQRTFLEIHLVPQANRLQGAGSMRFNGFEGLKIKQVEFNADRLHFEASTDQNTLTFDGQVTGDNVLGQITQAASDGKFHLTKILEIDQNIYDTYTGCYQLPADRVISISNFRGEMGCDYPVYLDHKSGQIRALFPISQTEFISGSTFLDPYPTTSKITFIKDEYGVVTGLQWDQAGETSWGSKVQFKEEEVQFTNGDVTLAGTLKLPLTKGPHPAVVLLHGSGEQSRDYADLPLISDFFALNGVAVLAYDKRGVGASTSGSGEGLLPNLAKDGLAGLALLKKHDEVRADQIGLWGLSQGGWIAPTAAALSPDVAFVIIVSGAAVGVVQQDLDRVANSLRSNRFSEAEVAAAVAHQRLFSEVCATGQGWTALEASIKKVQQEKWAQFVAIISKEAFDEGGLRWGRFRAYDPRPYLEKTTCPVLALFGEKDTIVPPAQNVGPMEAALKTGGNPDYTIKVFPNGTHTLISSKTGTMAEIPYQTKFVPDYFATMRDWILDRVDVVRP